MPLKTFFNLKEDKRNLILDYSFNEFSKYSYQIASVNNISKETNFSKGSFYQYFKDKKDMYIYLLSSALEEKNSFLEEKIKECESKDFFILLENDILNNISWEMKNADKSMLLFKARHEINDGETAGVADLVIRNSFDRIRSLLNMKDHTNNLLREDIDLNFNLSFINTIYINLYQYFTIRFGFTYEEFIAEGEYYVEKTELKNIIQNYINIIKIGLEK